MATWALALIGAAAMGLQGTRLARADAPAGGVAGKLLVATRAMPDGRFSETVIYMVEHDATGAMGLVVNLPLGKIPIGELLDGLGLEGEPVDGDIRVHYGGPVDKGRGFVLHSPDYAAKDTLFVDHGLALTATSDIVRDIATGAGPQQSLVVFGYAGWRAGQLEDEMSTGAWIAVPTDDTLVFDEDYEHKWERAISRRSYDL